MRRILVPVLVTACAVIALFGALGVGLLAWAAVDDARTPDPEPRGIDTLDVPAVERLAHITLPADATGLHTSYEVGIDYLVTACFTLPRAALPAFTADLPPFSPGGEPDALDGCPAPVAVLTGTPQHRAGPVYRTVVVSDPGDGRVTVYLSAFTT